MRRSGLFFLIAWIALGAAAGWLGIAVQDLTPALAMRYGLQHREGALVSRVQFGSPAMKGGLEEGDLIVSLDGEKISDSEGLKRILAQTPPGSPVELVVIRDRKERALEIVLGVPPRDAV